ncbi:MAG: CDP-diacylglycerol--serine O-phosphatidyltransferase [Methanobacteriota archaeon]
MRFRSITVADMFTLANGLLGFMAITYIIDRNFMLASFLILIAMVMDGLDGYFARRLGTERPIGRVLDSISDSISFCIAPALLVYGIFYDKELGAAHFSLQNILTIVASAMLAIFGIVRLVRYTRNDYAVETFLGLPTPATALAIILLTYLFSGKTGSFFYLSYQPYLVLLMCIAMSFIMISDLPYPKVRGWVQKGTLAGIALAAIPAVIATFDVGWSLFTLRAISVFAFMLTFGYVLGGPLVAWYATKDKKGV